jgi:hypothetical protein
MGKHHLGLDAVRDLLGLHFLGSGHNGALNRVRHERLLRGNNTGGAAIGDVPFLDGAETQHILVAGDADTGTTSFPQSSREDGPPRHAGFVADDLSDTVFARRAADVSPFP